jgi:3-oxoacyl-[acyl-carrier protein] reductase
MYDHANTQSFVVCTAAVAPGRRLAARSAQRIQAEISTIVLARPTSDNALAAAPGPLEPRMPTLANRVAIITGSGRGIGREIALKLASEGARVVINDLDEGPAEDTVATIRSRGGEAIAYVGNVTAKDFADGFVNAAIERFGGLDIIVNNAGYTWDSVIQKMTDEQWDAIVDVHMKAPFRVMRAASEYIRVKSKQEAADGREHFRKVVNISSIAGFMGNPGQANYSAAKAGVHGLTRTMMREWGRYKVNVNTVAFGLISTRLTVAADGGSTIKVEGRDLKVGVNPDFLKAAEAGIPLGRAGKPSEAAGAVYLLCTPESDYVTGQLLICAGGLY